VGIAIEQLRILIRVGAFRFTGKTKKQLLWDIHSIIGAEKKTEARSELFEIERKEFKLPELHYHKLDNAMDEIEILGFPLCSPFELLKENPPTKLTAGELKNHKGKMVEIVGYLVTTKYTRTKYKENMMFGTFLDSEGNFF